MLDYANDVEEAIAIIKNFNIDFQGGTVPCTILLQTDRDARSWLNLWSKNYRCSLILIHGR